MDLRAALDAVLGVPATDGNRLTLLRNGDEIFPAMLEAIRTAQESVELLTFIWWDGDIAGQFTEALVERARAGVHVRVVLDAVGSRYADEGGVAAIRAAGGQVVWFRPVRLLGGLRPTHRTHRKVLVCDRRVAFTGGVGIADHWLGAPDRDGWRDTHARVEGPAVDGLHGAFLANWAEAGGRIFDPPPDHLSPQPTAGSSAVAVVRGEAGGYWSDVTMLVSALLRLAEERVRIATAYFCPGSSTQELLAETARRGVRVELLLPGERSDKRFAKLAGQRCFEELLAAGVAIHWYAPTMLHCKVISVDGRVASLGSANVNSRSLSLDDEVNLLIHDPDVVAQLDADFDVDLTRSERVQPRRWRGRPVSARLLEVATRPGAPFA